MTARSTRLSVHRFSISTVKAPLGACRAGRSIFNQVGARAQSRVRHDGLTIPASETARPGSLLFCIGRRMHSTGFCVHCLSSQNRVFRTKYRASEKKRLDREQIQQSDAHLQSRITLSEAKSGPFNGTSSNLRMSCAELMAEGNATRFQPSPRNPASTSEPKRRRRPRRLRQAPT
jgi:hypothetical protein